MGKYKAVSLQISIPLYEKLKQRATDSLRSINKEIIYCIKKELNETGANEIN